MKGFYGLLTEAVADLSEHGYDSQERLDRWMQVLREAAERDTPSVDVLRQRLDLALQTLYRRNVEKGALLKYHPSLDRYTLDRIRPDLRLELDRRILASADLIRLNRDQAINRTLQRFSGWATSIPSGGSKVVRRMEVRKHVFKSLAQVKHENRRLEIDQGHKLISSINSVVATQSGAIAMQWHSHWKQPGYHYRPDHKDRDKKFYAIRDSWAIREHLINRGSGYSDEMTQPSEEVFCRCYATYFNYLQDLPESMMTAKGKKFRES